MDGPGKAALMAGGRALGLGSGGPATQQPGLSLFDHPNARKGRLGQKRGVFEAFRGRKFIFRGQILNFRPRIFIFRPRRAKIRPRPVDFRPRPVKIRPRPDASRPRRVRIRERRFTRRPRAVTRQARLARKRSRSATQRECRGAGRSGSRRQRDRRLSAHPRPARGRGVEFSKKLRCPAITRWCGHAGEVGIAGFSLQSPLSSLPCCPQNRLTRRPSMVPSASRNCLQAAISFLLIGRWISTSQVN